MINFLILSSLFFSFALLGALCGVGMWMMKLEDRVRDIDDRVLKLELVKANAFIRNAAGGYLWTPSDQEEADHD